MQRLLGSKIPILIPLLTRKAIISSSKEVSKDFLKEEKVD
jgi:hypothetical protein